MYNASKIGSSRQNNNTRKEVKRMRRSLEEVRARCKTVLNDEMILNLVDKSSSPTAAFEMIMAETKDQAKAKAGRWLAILRRDYFEDYQSINSN